MTDTNIFPTTIPTPTLAPENEGAIQYLLVALAGHEYGVLMGNLQEVLRYNPAAVAPVPNTPQWLEGVFSLRGTIISVVNLRIFLGLPRAEDGAGHPGLMPGQGELFGIGGAVPRLVVLHDEELIV